MQKFIGVKFVEAEPMTRGAYNEYKSWVLPQGEDASDVGYLVRYASGYESWCPIDEFTKQNVPFTGNTAVTQEDVNNFVGSISVNNLQVGGVDRTTMVTAILINGFIIHETSTCVDPESYDEKVGAAICLKKINDRLWSYLGFMLQCGTCGFKVEQAAKETK